MKDRLKLLREVKRNVTKDVVILVRSFCFEPVYSGCEKCLRIIVFILRTNWLGSRVLNFVFIRAITKILDRENIT